MHIKLNSSSETLFCLRLKSILVEFYHYLTQRAQKVVAPIFMAIMLYSFGNLITSQVINVVENNTIKKLTRNHVKCQNTWKIRF